MNCKQNDAIFNAPKPPPLIQYAPAKDLSREPWGALMIKTRDCIDWLKERKMDLVRRNDLAYKSRIEILGEQIDALMEVSRRITAKIQEQRNAKNSQLQPSAHADRKDTQKGEGPKNLGK